MADNYLEKKFEEYAAAKAGRRAPHRMSPAGNRQGVVEFKFPRRRVVVAVPDADAVIELSAMPDARWLSAAQTLTAVRHTPRL